MERQRGGRIDWEKNDFWSNSLFHMKINRFCNNGRSDVFVEPGKNSMREINCNKKIRFAVAAFKYIRYQFCGTDIHKGEFRIIFKIYAFWRRLKHFLAVFSIIFLQEAFGDHQINLIFEKKLL